MSDAFIGEIRLFGFDFAPEDWAYCSGQTMDVQQYQALYSIIGETYGSVTPHRNFKLPNLNGRVPLGMGAGPGLSPAKLAATGGAADVTLTSTQLAPHQHTVVASLQAPLQNVATAALAIGTTANQRDYSSKNIDPWTVTDGLNTATVGSALGNGTNPVPVLAHDNRQPYLSLNFCIALSGEYPVRP